MYTDMPLAMQMSLSARRAWIEIIFERKAGDEIGSLSARRAWIEIALCNAGMVPAYSRSPQGERG